MIASHFDKDTGIIESKLTGMITFEEVCRYINLLNHPENYPKKILILTDSFQGRFEFSEEEDLQMVRLIRKYLPSFESIRNAIVVDDPRTTAFSILYRRAAASIPNYQFEIFSTREAAFRWLLS